MSNEQTKQSILTFIKTLSGRCDGAIKNDKVGFSKAHQAWGNSMALYPLEVWRDDDLYIARHVVLPRYVGQLKQMGLDLSSIPTIEAPHWFEREGCISEATSRHNEFLRKQKEGEAQRKRLQAFIDNRIVDVDEGCFTIAWQRGDQDFTNILNDVRALENRRFDARFARWNVPFRLKSKVMAIAENYNFTVTPEAAAVEVTAPKKGNEPSPNRLENKGDHFELYFEYSAEMVSAVKGIPRNLRSFEKQPSVHWTVKKELEALKILDTIVQDEVFSDNDRKMVQKAIEGAKEKRERNVVLSKGVSNEGLDPSLRAAIEKKIRGTLRPFQEVAVQYVADNKKLFIADDMGVGKTLESISSIVALDLLPAVFVCPASLKLNIAKEILSWSNVSCSIINKGKRPIKLRLIDGSTGYVKLNDWGAPIVVINYELLDRGDNLEKLLARNNKCVVLDECHAIKNHKAKRTQRAKELMKEVDYRILMSGTPLLNRPSELIAQLTAMGRLNDLGGWMHFAEHYCDAEKTRFGWDLSGAKNLNELHDKMRELGMYIRRTKHQVLTELPDKQRVTIPVELTNRREYDKAHKDLVGWLGEQAAEVAKESKAYNVAVKALRGEAISDEDKERYSDVIKRYQSVMAALKSEQLVRFEHLKKLSVEGKFAGVVQWVREFLEGGEKLVVFGHHTEYLTRLADEFNAPMIVGDTSLVDRQKAVDAFQNDENCRLIVGNIKAMGVGLTLTASCNVVFFELGWEPNSHDQAEDRCLRMGQKNAVSCWYLLGQDTIDEEIADLIEKKRKVTQAVIDGKPMDSSDNSGIIGDLTAALTQMRKNAEKVVKDLHDGMKDVLFD